MNMQEKAKMSRSTRAHVQAALRTGQLTLDQWDARCTEDGKVSVLDVIADVTGKNAHYASNVYRDLVREERAPDCEKRSLPPRSDSFTGVAQPTPVATAAEMVQIVWQLPGTAEFRRNCARTVVRYLGGDESLVDRWNRATRERLASDNPSRPTRVSGEATSSAPDVAERAVKLRRLRAETVQLEIGNLNACVQALAAIGEDMDDAMIWSYRDRMSKLLAQRS